MDSTFGLQLLIQKINTLYKTLQIPEGLPLGPDAVISGSFMWHVLTSTTKTKWLPNDIDIFCTKKAVSRLRKYLVNNNFMLSSMKSLQYTMSHSVCIEEWYLSDNLFDEQKYIDFCEDNDLPPLPKKFLVAHKKGSTCIQLVISSSYTTVKASELIINSFDFPVLENWFDGKNVHISYPELLSLRTSNTREYEPRDILEEAHLNEHLELIKKRYYKYLTRGMNIIPSKQLQKFLDK